MSFVELVERVARATKLPKAIVSAVLRALPLEVEKALESDSSVKLTGFGAFYVVETKPKAIPGKTEGPGSRKIRFRQSRRK